MKVMSRDFQSLLVHRQIYLFYQQCSFPSFVFNNIITSIIITITIITPLTEKSVYIKRLVKPLKITVNKDFF